MRSRARTNCPQDEPRGSSRKVHYTSLGPDAPRPRVVGGGGVKAPEAAPSPSSASTRRPTPSKNLAAAPTTSPTPAPAAPRPRRVRARPARMATTDSGRGETRRVAARRLRVRGLHFPTEPVVEHPRRRRANASTFLPSGRRAHSSSGVVLAPRRPGVRLRLQATTSRRGGRRAPLRHDVELGRRSTYRGRRSIVRGF